MNTEGKEGNSVTRAMIHDTRQGDAEFIQKITEAKITTICQKRTDLGNVFKPLY